MQHHSRGWHLQRPLTCRGRLQLPSHAGLQSKDRVNRRACNAIAPCYATLRIYQCKKVFMYGQPCSAHNPYIFRASRNAFSKMKPRRHISPRKLDMHACTEFFHQRSRTVFFAEVKATIVLFVFIGEPGLAWPRPSTQGRSSTDSQPVFTGGKERRHRKVLFG